MLNWKFSWVLGKNKIKRGNFLFGRVSKYYMPLTFTSRKIFQQIITEMQMKSPQKLSTLAKTMNLPIRTVKRYVEIIMDIQGAPEIQWTEVDKTTVLRMRKDDIKWKLWKLYHS